MDQFRTHIQMKNSVIEGLIHLLMLSKKKRKRKKKQQLEYHVLIKRNSNPFLSAEIVWILFLSFYLYLSNVLQEKIIITSRRQSY